MLHKALSILSIIINNILGYILGHQDSLGIIIMRDIVGTEVMVTMEVIVTTEVMGILNKASEHLDMDYHSRE
jgi:hypothetical protein